MLPTTMQAGPAGVWEESVSPGGTPTWVTALDFLKKTTKFLVGCEEFDAEQQEGTFLPP